jgi:hypothetical protein
MRKNKVLIATIVALFTLSLLSAVPTSANTITGKHSLWRVLEYYSRPDNYIMIDPGNFTYADEMTYLIRTKINDYANGSLLAVNITGQTITGAQVWLWLSETGGAVIEPNDTFYAGPFELIFVTQMNATYYKLYVDPASGQNFWVGNNLIVGPCPTALAIPKGIEYYIKMTDVAPTTTSIPSSDVAVSENKWRPYESLSIQPKAGPAGTQIAATGMAWDPSKLVNLTWSTMMNTTTGTVVVGLISPNTDGTFTTSFYAPDEKWTNGSDITKWVNAYYNGSTLANDWESFMEYGREWLQVKVTAPADQGTPWATGASVEIFDVIWVSGNYFNPRSDVSLYWDWGIGSQELLATATVNGTGFFNTSVTIPISNMGLHWITAVDYSFNFNASVSVIPTLILNPNEGPIGTEITAIGYGFPNNASNINVTIWWDYTCWCEGCEPTPMNMTVTKTDPDGHFEVTFLAPASVGGLHEVWARYETDGGPPALPLGIGEYPTDYPWDPFTILPTLTITPSSVYNNGTKVTVTATGLSTMSMIFDDDNALIYDLCLDYEKDFYVFANCSGILEFEFYATAGMEPGIHAVALYKYAGIPDLILDLETVEFFTVMTEEDPAVIMKLDEILTDLDEIDTTLTAIADDIENIDFSAIQDAITDAETEILAAIAGLDAVTQNAATAATQASTSAGTAAQAASDAKTAAEATQGTVSGISTAVYLAIVLSLVAALAAIAGVILLQRKVA